MQKFINFTTHNRPTIARANARARSARARALRALAQPKKFCARVRALAQSKTLNISYFFCKIKNIVASEQSIVFWVCNGEWHVSQKKKNEKSEED